MNEKSNGSGEERVGVDLRDEGSDDGNEDDGLHESEEQDVAKDIGLGGDGVFLPAFFVGLHANEVAKGNGDEEDDGKGDGDGACEGRIGRGEFVIEEGEEEDDGGANLRGNDSEPNETHDDERAMRKLGG